MEFTLDKIPLKYILGSYVDSDQYPEPLDIIYLMTKRASDRGKNISPVIFTSTSLIKKVGQERELNIMKSLDELEKTGYIENKGETKTGTSFRIIKNPFI